MPHKTFPARVKLASDDDQALADAAAAVDAAADTSVVETGVFEALVSVFGNVDSYGERVMPGAFTRTLADWVERGDPIPVYYSHRLDDPDMNIGHVLEAKETDAGLWVKAQLDLEAPKAVTTLRLMKGGRLTQFSFSYAVSDGGAKEADDGVVELSEIDLYEVGPTPIGANAQTELIGVKSGRVLSAKNEALVRDARDALTELLTALKDDDGKASQASRVKDEAAARSKSEEPHAQWSADLWSYAIQLETL